MNRSKPTSQYKLGAAHLLTQYWWLIVLFWIVLAITLRMVAPSWSQIAQDGDLQFLPDHLPSRQGQAWLETGFPNHQARSQIVVVIARGEHKIQGSDLVLGLDLGRQFSHAVGVAAFRRWHAEGRPKQESSHSNLTGALRALDDSIELDELWFDSLRAVAPTREDLHAQRLAIAYWDRAQVHDAMGNVPLSEADRETARLLKADIDKNAAMESREPFAWDALLDSWTWKDPVLGSKLGEGNLHARMIVLQSKFEFIAANNIGLLIDVESMLDRMRQRYDGLVDSELQLGITGSAAVGGDMLRAAATSVQQTEWVTILLILIILAIVYRGPLLVAIPLISIGLSLIVTQSVVALLAVRPGSDSQFGIQVYTTTRIFLVVLLFGAGTDFCLFFIARCRESLADEASAMPNRVRKLIAASWINVYDALLGSALTTIVGLGLMVFADFKKFSFTGPIIGLGLSITILVCLTFTPALVCGLGRWAFWPSLKFIPKPKKGAGAKAEGGQVAEALAASTTSGLSSSRSLMMWERIANTVITHPKSVLLVCMIFLGIPAVHGWMQGDWVTYDFAKELSPNSVSRRGSQMLEKFFGSQDSPAMTVVVIAEKQGSDEKQIREQLDHLRQKLYLPGVKSVRSLTDPLGDFPPDRKMSMLEKDAWRRRLLENHRSTQQLYVSSTAESSKRVARFDLLIEPSPFSIDAEKILSKIQERMNQETHSKDSAWYQAQFACTGTTPGIFDLKTVTQADQHRIQILVTLGVWGVLILMLRRIWMSGYLILTVLLSYLTTLGLTLWFFQWAYGADFVGLDWKVPMFLFVILVAVGQDYNVYLTTRVLEEQSKHGAKQGLRRAMVMTGGIITSCGIVMAGTFASMTSGAILPALASLGFPGWIVGSPDAPVLRGIVELGFALALGVLIDTLVVRTILVPAVFALLTRTNKLSST